MRVLHLINTLSAGGAELHLLTLCRYLKSRGIDVSVACLREEVRGSRSLRAEFEKENIRIFNLGADSRYNFSFLFRLASLVRQEGPDILHTHLPRADIAGAFLSLFLKSPALLSSVHGIYRDRWFGTWAAPFMRRGYRRTDRVIAISAAVKNWLKLELGVCEDKITVIHYGIEPEPFTCSGETGRTPAADGPHIGSIGRLEPGKGFDCLIRAMKIVHEQLPSASLRIAGHDPLGYGKALQSLIEELALNEQVKLTGFEKDVPSFLRNIDVFAFASLSEGFGQVIIETMAAGKPVVASNIAPLTEIVTHGQTGFLVKPDDPQAFADAIVRLLVRPEQAKKMGSHGRQRVYKCFLARKMADETLTLYESLRRSSHHELASVP
jgi:glycosyltransferase involved in cell wall biosynthesis